MEEKLSNEEEKNWRATQSEKDCKDANYNNHGYRCGSFKLISQTSAESLDGYPTITTKYTETRQYPDKNVGTTPTVVVEKLIYHVNMVFTLETTYG